MESRGRDANQLSVLTGLSAGTIRGFLRPKDPTDSSLGNVILMALGLGMDLSELFAAPSGLAPEEPARSYERLAADNPQATVTIRDINGQAIYVSPSSRLVGYEPEDFIRLTPDETLDLVHPDDREKMTAELGDVIANEGKRAEVEYLLKTKDGRWIARISTFWVERGEKGAQVLVQIDRPASAEAG